MIDTEGCAFCPHGRDQHTNKAFADGTPMTPMIWCLVCLDACSFVWHYLTAFDNHHLHDNACCRRSE